MRLRQLCIEDAEGMLEWMHDPTINCNFRFHAAAYNLEQAKDFILKAKDAYKEGKTYHWAITEDGKEYLGTISLKDIDLENRNAEYAICLRKCAMGKGIAYEATQYVLEYAFTELDLHRIYLNVLSDNEKAIHLYERCGFQFEGEWKEHLYLKGRYRSLKWYGIQKEEWMKQWKR